MNPQQIRYFLPAIVFFILFNLCFLVFSSQLSSWGFDKGVLITGNLLIFLVTFFSYYMNLRGLLSKNNHSFFRFVYGSFILKLFLIGLGAFIYIILEKEQVNKPGIFFCMGLYLLYTFIEVAAVQKVSRKKSNA